MLCHVTLCILLFRSSRFPDRIYCGMIFLRYNNNIGMKGRGAARSYCDIYKVCNIRSRETHCCIPKYKEEAKGIIIYLSAAPSDDTPETGTQGAHVALSLNVPL